MNLHGRDGKHLRVLPLLSSITAPERPEDISIHFFGFQYSMALDDLSITIEEPRSMKGDGRSGLMVPGSWSKPKSEQM